MFWKEPKFWCSGSLMIWKSENIWYQNFSEILRHFRPSEAQKIRLSVILRASDNQAVRRANFQTFSVIFSDSQTVSVILRSSGNQIFRIAEIKISRSFVLQTLRYCQTISSHQAVSPSGLQIFSDYLRTQFHQTVRITDLQGHSDYQRVSTSDTLIFSECFRYSLIIRWSDSQESSYSVLFRPPDSKYMMFSDWFRIFQAFWDYFRS